MGDRIVSILYSSFSYSWSYKCLTTWIGFVVEKDTGFEIFKCVSNLKSAKQQTVEILTIQLYRRSLKNYVTYEKTKG